jgi:Tfp pilus assembly protein PilV
MPRTGLPLRERGATLIEALLALLAMSLGMLAVVGMQSTLRLHGDIAKQRSEAVRLAQEEMESLRAFASLDAADGLKAYADIEPELRDAPEPDASNARYTIERRVADEGGLVGFKTVAIDVRWQDRQGETAAVTLYSVLPAIAPATSGLLALAASGLPQTKPLGRLSRVPYPVGDLGDGRSVYKPIAGGARAWIFDNRGGGITSRCTVLGSTRTETLTIADLENCETVEGHLLSGVVRFDTDGSVDAEHPGSSALDLQMQFALQGEASAECHDDAPASPSSAQTSVRYTCLVYRTPGTDGQPLRWSGRLSALPIGWAYGSSAAQYRLCRYSADHDASDSIANNEHPDSYTGVGEHLLNQNFLVVRGDIACPADGPAHPETGDLVDSSTAQHEPSGA